MCILLFSLFQLPCPSICNNFVRDSGELTSSSSVETVKRKNAQRVVHHQAVSQYDICGDDDLF